MIIDSAAYTNEGGRKINEDSFFCGEGVYAVADGLGGHGNGDKASACAVEHLRSNCHGAYGEEKINEILQGANEAVCALNELSGDSSRTTIAAAFTDNETLRMANVGDSRVYYFRGGRVFTCTKDHSVCQASVEMGLIRPEDIRNSPDRSRLLKVLGNEKNLNIKKGYPPIQMQNGDAFLICSDGFWEYIHETEMEADLLKSDSAEKWMNFMLRRHLLKAHNEGDNYTLICGLVYSVDGSAAVKKKSPLIPIIIAAAVLLAAAATACFFIFGGNGDAIDVAAETTTVSEVTTTPEITEITTIAETTTETPVTTVQTTVPETATETAATTIQTEASTTAVTTTVAVTTTDVTTVTVPETVPAETTTLSEETAAERVSTTNPPPNGTDYDVI